MSGKQAWMTAAGSADDQDARDFATVCASLCADNATAAQADFPLRRRVRLQSRIDPGFQSDDFLLQMPSRQDAEAGLPVMQIAFLTLAGPGGALPWWVTEKVLRNASGDGKALHRFLDLLNRRFWELLFLKSGLGTNPQHGFRSPHHTSLFIELSFAMAGLQRHSMWSDMPEQAGLLHRIMQHCWATVGGGGSADALAALLSEACACKVVIHARRLVRVPVANQARLTLGHVQSARLSRTGGVIGTRALVTGGLLLRIVVPAPELLDEYLPPAESTRLAVLRRVLQIFYAQNLPQVALRLQCIVDETFARLGGTRCRLGWGASLSTPRPYSTIVELSASAMRAPT